MPTLIILKLGGSIITDKSGWRPAIRTVRVRRMAAELRRAWSRQPGLRLTVLYGGGSFGHPLAHRYQLHGKRLNTERLHGLGRTINSMRALGTALASIFLAAGLPIIPLQTSTAARLVKGKLELDHASALPIIRNILRRRGIPLLGGDAAFTDDGRSAIVSADALAVALANHFTSAAIAFATDVDGVYRTFPPRRGERPLTLISRKQLVKLSKSATWKKKCDVTGGMAGKLNALLQLDHCRAIIFNGTEPAALRAVLAGKSMGTAIRF